MTLNRRYNPDAMKSLAESCYKANRELSKAKMRVKLSAMLQGKEWADGETIGTIFKKKEIKQND